METTHPNHSNNNNKTSERTAVKMQTVTENHAGQRIDNFLMRELKDVPRSYIYRILRKGEVRVNKKRVKPPYKLNLGDIVRVPPVFLKNKEDVLKAPDSLLKMLQVAITLEDENLIIINKPSGLAVHGGSGIKYGLIESIRQLRPDLEFVELVHRLDKETSGLVMLAKNRGVLLELHTLIKAGKIKKYYQTLVKGCWQGNSRHIKNILKREQGKKQKVRVISDETTDKGKQAESIFYPLQDYKNYSLLKVELLTGRMHQIRTQLAHMNHPLMGDSQYGDFTANREFKKQTGLKRLFLHAYHLKFTLPESGKQYDCKVPLADDLLNTINRIK